MLGEVQIKYKFLSLLLVFYSHVPMHYVLISNGKLKRGGNLRLMKRHIYVIIKL